MLQMTSVKTTGDYIPYVSEDIGRKEIVIDVESERIVIASVMLNEPELKCNSMLKCEKPSEE